MHTRLFKVPIHPRKYSLSSLNQSLNPNRQIPKEHLLLEQMLNPKPHISQEILLEQPEMVLPLWRLQRRGLRRRGMTPEITGFGFRV